MTTWSRILNSGSIVTKDLWVSYYFVSSWFIKLYYICCFISISFIEFSTTMIMYHQAYHILSSNKIYFKYLYYIITVIYHFILKYVCMGWNYNMFVNWVDSQLWGGMNFTTYSLTFYVNIDFTRTNNFVAQVGSPIV